MKLERTKNASRNIIFGLLLKIYQIFVPFLMRTAMVYYLGVEYLGVSSLFTSILAVLNLAELGIGSALVFSMYKPIAEDDSETICALMNLYKKYYRIIGAVILATGIIITPALPYLVKGDLPQGLNLYILYYLNLFATVLSYWIFAYKQSLLSAFQRIDIGSKINLIINTLLYIGQFTVLVLFRNYYFYIILTLLAQVITNVVTAIIVNKMYPDYQAIGKLPKEQVKQINRKVKDLFTAKLGSVITNSADTLVISSFLGLTVLAVYNNYYYIISSIIGFATIGFAALTAGIGNSLETESKEKNYADFQTITYIAMGAVCVCSCCFLNIFQPFMKIWMGEKLMLKYAVVVCFVLYFIIYEINALLNLFKDAAGIWHQDRFRPLVVSLVNLLLNLISVNYLGLYGVILSTVISMGFIGIPWVTRNLFHTIFEKREMFQYIKKLIIYFVGIVIICAVDCGICYLIRLDGILEIIIKLICSMFISLAIYILLTLRTNSLKNSVKILRKIIKR